MSAPRQGAEVALVDVEKRFGRTDVLRGVTLSIGSGQSAAILGPSGCGKTTVLRVLAGFEAADRGTVAVGGEVVDGGGDGARTWIPAHRRGVGYLPQEGALFPHLTVAGNVAFGLPRGSDRRRRVPELLDLVALHQELADRRPDQLSGGQQQRVALARALAAEPRVLLLDEPFASLDADLRAAMRETVHGLLRRTGVTTIFVTHDMADVDGFADAVYRMRDGRVEPMLAT
jgi:iron(III) transport system ATP-binding protein